MAVQSRSETKVTIGLCVKNSEKTLRQAIEKILDQDYPKELVEIIVVDGGSKDETVSIASSMISNSGMLFKFYCDNGEGLAKARQIVVDNACSKYVVWVDGDVLLDEHFIENQIVFMEQNLPVGVAFGRFIFRRNISTTLPAALEDLGKYAGSAEYARTRKQRWFPANDAYALRVEASKQVGGFDTKIKGAGEDVDFIRRMREKGWLTIVNEKAKYCTITRETWQDLWREQVWYGYGNHMLNHKYKDIRSLLYGNPLLSLYGGFKEGFKAFRLTSERRSFLLPLSFVFSATAKSYGYFKAHLQGYGHVRLSKHETNEGGRATERHTSHSQLLQPNMELQRYTAKPKPRNLRTPNTDARARNNRFK